MKIQASNNKTPEHLENNLDKLAKFSISPKPKAFAFFLDQIYNLSMLAYEFGKTNDEISENDFRQLVGEIFSAMKEYFEKE